MDVPSQMMALRATVEHDPAAGPLHPYRVRVAAAAWRWTVFAPPTAYPLTIPPTSSSSRPAFCKHASNSSTYSVTRPKAAPSLSHPSARTSSGFPPPHPRAGCSALPQAKPSRLATMVSRPRPGPSSARAPRAWSASRARSGSPSRRPCAHGRVRSRRARTPTGTTPCPAHVQGGQHAARAPEQRGLIDELKGRLVQGRLLCTPRERCRHRVYRTRRRRARSQVPTVPQPVSDCRRGDCNPAKRLSRGPRARDGMSAVLTYAWASVDARLFREDAARQGKCVLGTVAHRYLSRE